MKPETENSMLLVRGIHTAALLHQGQIDKCGEPYILHPLRLMLRCKPTELQMAAVLHDVIEDTHITAYELIHRCGIPEGVVRIVEVLTRRPDEPYSEYITRVSQDPKATEIKILDLEDNLDYERMKKISDVDTQERLRAKYTPALATLRRVAWNRRLPTCPRCGGPREYLDSSHDPEGLRRDIVCTACDWMWGCSRSSYFDLGRPADVNQEDLLNG